MVPKTLTNHSAGSSLQPLGSSCYNYYLPFQYIISICRASVTVIMGRHFSFDDIIMGSNHGLLTVESQFIHMYKSLRQHSTLFGHSGRSWLIYHKRTVQFLCMVTACWWYMASWAAYKLSWAQALMVFILLCIRSEVTIYSVLGLRLHSTLSSVWGYTLLCLGSGRGGPRQDAVHLCRSHGPQGEQDDIRDPVQHHHSEHEHEDDQDVDDVGGRAGHAPG